MNRLVITIGRQFGSGGREIGRKLAERFGIDYLDKELLTLAAEKSGISEEILARADEKPASPFSFAARYPTALAAGFVAPINLHSAMTDDHLFSVQAAAIREEAEKRNCIIVGRCSDYIIGRKEYCVNVFVHAPLPWRVRRVAANYEIAPEEAEKQIRRIDKKRAAYYNFYTGKRWGDMDGYDLSVDVSTIGIDKTVQIIADYAAVKVPDFRIEPRPEEEA